MSLEMKIKNALASLDDDIDESLIEELKNFVINNCSKEYFAITKGSVSYLIVKNNSSIYDLLSEYFHVDFENARDILSEFDHDLVTEGLEYLHTNENNLSAVCSGRYTTNQDLFIFKDVFVNAHTKKYYEAD